MDDPSSGHGGPADPNGMGGGLTMVVLLSAPRGRISAARMAARRDEVEEAYGIIIRPSRVAEAEAAPAARPRLTVGGES
jgi:hypothetical protein